MGGNDRLKVRRELESLREQDKRSDRMRWYALWVATIGVFVLLWVLFFRGN